VSEIKKNSILIVDDERASLKALTLILNADYTIYAAMDGLDAVETAKEFLPDLILLDIMMPKMDGYEVLAELKKWETLKDIPVIFITGLDKVEDEEKGLIMDAADYISKPFSPTIVRLRIRNQIKMLNQIRIIEHLSMVDQLTEIPNRRSFDNQLKTEWSRAVRESKPISVLIVDVDNFKKYNDQYGHPQGDAALKAIAGIFTDTLKRATDFTARLGGEEFAILLPGTDLRGALEIAGEILYNVENASILLSDGTVTKLTVSIGINTQSPTQEDSIDFLVKYADRALYAAKETGRNKICHYG
jgi:diguanylate cyclase (GGDEF)-like protein